MKCLGLIGNLTAPNLDTYLQTIRSEAQKSLGTDEMPRLLVHCAETRHLKACFDRADWPGLTKELTENGRSLAKSGADAMVICGSALNPIALEVHRALDIPVIDLGYSLVTKLRGLRFRKVAILGIRTLEEEAMWRESLDDISVVQPEHDKCEWLAHCMDTVVKGQPIPVEWKIETNRVVSSLRRGGAQALILADPTLGQWIKPGESLLYPIDAAEVHAWTATLWALRAEFLPAPGCVICV